MAPYLIVAHQTAASPELIEKLREIQSDDLQAEFVLLVPATPVGHLLISVDDDGENMARRRALDAFSVLSEAGINVTDSVVGQADPLLAIKAEFGRRQPTYELTIISTLPAGISRWLRRDLPNKVRSQLGTRVVEVISHSVVSNRQGMRITEAPDALSIDNPQPRAAMDLRSLSGWLGRDLYCLDGVAGRIREVIYDYVSREPIWVGVASRPLSLRTLLVPALGLSVEDAHLKANLTRERIMSQPPTEVGEGFASLTDEEHLYLHFGIPFSEIRDIRVLRTGQELPGLETNQQTILQPEAPLPSLPRS